MEDTTIPSSTPTTGSGKILYERSDPSTRRSRGTVVVISRGAASQIEGVPVSTMFGAVRNTFGGEFADATGGATRGIRGGGAIGGGTIGGCATDGAICRTDEGVSRETVRDASGGSARGGTGEPIGGEIRWGIGGAVAGLTRCAIGGVTTGGVTRCVIDGAAGAACGFSTKMRSRHLGHRMHAPFAPFSNTSFRRYSVMQELHWTTMPIARTVPRRISCHIIGRYSVKSKHLAMGRYMVEGRFIQSESRRMNCWSRSGSVTARSRSAGRDAGAHLVVQAVGRRSNNPTVSLHRKLQIIGEIECRRVPKCERPPGWGRSSMTSAGRLGGVPRKAPRKSPASGAAYISSPAPDKSTATKTISWFRLTSGLESIIEWDNLSRTRFLFLDHAKQGLQQPDRNHTLPVIV